MPQADSFDTTTLPVTRQQIEAQIDLLIDALDSLDADPDDEPSLGYTNSAFNSDNQTHPDFLCNGNAGDDREADDEREPSEDSEPSLGWTDNPHQGCAAWQANAYSDDREDGTGPVRKKRPPSRTGGDVYRGCRVLGHPPAKPPRNPTVLRVWPKGVLA